MKVSVGSSSYSSCSQYRFLNRSYVEYCTITQNNEKLDFKEWCKHMASKHHVTIGTSILHGAM